MARQLRIHVPGGLYHVILRGNGGQDVFFEDEDHYRLYLLMQEGVERFGHRIHGYCLMTNHLLWVPKTHCRSDHGYVDTLGPRHPVGR